MKDPIHPKEEHEHEQVAPYTSEGGLSSYKPKNNQPGNEFNGFRVSLANSGARWAKEELNKYGYEGDFPAKPEAIEEAKTRLATKRRLATAAATAVAEKEARREEATHACGNQTPIIRSASPAQQVMDLRETTAAAGYRSVKEWWRAECYAAEARKKKEEEAKGANDACRQQDLEAFAEWAELFRTV